MYMHKRDSDELIDEIFDNAKENKREDTDRIIDEIIESAKDNN
jgi:hypothetical protein